MKRASFALGAAALLAGGAILLRGGSIRAATSQGTVSDTLRVPAGTRVRVAVVNATKTRGLGRRAMLYLRDRGFDVVSLGTAAKERDVTVVQDHGTTTRWAGVAAAVMGGARVESRPDSSRYLDVTVIIGRSWRPPAEPFYP